MADSLPIRTGYSGRGSSCVANSTPMRLRTVAKKDNRGYCPFTLKQAEQADAATSSSQDEHRFDEIGCQWSMFIMHCQEPRKKSKDQAYI
ncbi:hypothetical protein BIW11_06783, partial [Tropilaelaps mercedesae]